ncbi:MAG: hypothetical protein WC254_05785 [Candidatus Woesearchaeota archaeon]|jgi:hypothetical protein
MQVFLVQCPQCHNKMKFMPFKIDTLFGKKKRCVYCGKTFSIREHIVQ